MLRLYTNIAYFSLRLKGPRSQREALKSGTYGKTKIEEDRFKEYYDGTLQLYVTQYLGTKTTLPNSNSAIQTKPLAVYLVSAMPHLLKF